MAVGQRQRLYSGVRMFTGNYLSSTPRALRPSGVYLELKPLMLYSTCAVSYGYSTVLTLNTGTGTYRKLGRTASKGRFTDTGNGRGNRKCA
jgi:hypothetical protein